MLDVCLCLDCSGVCGVGGACVGGVDQGLEGWCRCQDQVSVNCAMLIPAYLFMADMANTGLFVSCCRTWICLAITRLYEASASAFPACPKTVNRDPIAGVGSINSIYTATCRM